MAPVYDGVLLSKYSFLEAQGFIWFMVYGFNGLLLSMVVSTAMNIRSTNISFNQENSGP